MPSTAESNSKSLPAVSGNPPIALELEQLLPACDYNLAATLTSGQAFRWRERDSGWEGVVHGRWVRLQQTAEGILARCAAPVPNWDWLRHYLQTEVDLGQVLQTFPRDVPLQTSVEACRGLRLLRQDPWECLISFICSSTKQIVQIQEIIDLLCRRFGELLPHPPSSASAFSFPSAERLALVSEEQLRACKMGFRAPYVLATARAVATGQLELSRLEGLPCAEAREILMHLPGVGEKVANCVLLFAYGFQSAFPVDVWVMKALKELYFPKRRPRPARLRQFVNTYFGPNAGYAQQYLFHYMRKSRRIAR